MPRGLAAESIMKDQFKTNTSYNQVEQLEVEIAKLRDVIREQQAELLQLYRIFDRPTGEM